MNLEKAVERYYLAVKEKHKAMKKFDSKIVNCYNRVYNMVSSMMDNRVERRNIPNTDIEYPNGIFNLILKRLYISRKDIKEIVFEEKAFTIYYKNKRKKK